MKSEVQIGSGIVNLTIFGFSGRHRIIFRFGRDYRGHMYQYFHFTGKEAGPVS